MSGARAPQGLFHVRDPLSEILDARGRRLATLPPDAPAAAPIRSALEAGEELARRRLAASSPEPAVGRAT